MAMTSQKKKKCGRELERVREMAVLKDPGQCCWVLKTKKGNHRQGEQIASRSWKKQ